MTDPFSIATGLIAIGGAAHTIAKVAHSFYHVAHDAGSIAEDIEFFGSHISTFGAIASSIRYTIHDHITHYPESLVLKKFAKHDVLSDLKSQINHLMRRSEGLRPRKNADGIGLGWKARLQWVLQKTKRDELCVWMGRVQSAFFLLTLQVTYEALQLRASSEDITPEEVAQLRSEMRDNKMLTLENMRAMRAFQDRLLIFQGEKLWHSRTESGDPAYDRVEKLLLDQGAKTLESKEPPRETSHHKDPENAMTLSLSRRPQNRNDQDKKQPDHTIEVPETRSSNFSVPPNLPIPHSSDNPRDVGDYVSVQPSHKLLRCDMTQVRAIRGRAGETSTIAIFNEEFRESVISHSFALEINAEIEELDEHSQAKEICFDGDHRAQVQGVATFVWSEDLSPNLRPFRVRCNVCVKPPSRLILGQDFLRKRRHYWRR